MSDYSIPASVVEAALDRAGIDGLAACRVWAEIAAGLDQRYAEARARVFGPDAVPGYHMEAHNRPQRTAHNTTERP